MDLPRHILVSTDLTCVLDNSTAPKPSQQRYTSSNTSGEVSSKHSEYSSESSSNSGASLENPIMTRGYQRGGSGGHRGSRGGGRTLSNSSGSSDQQFNPNRPTIRPSSTP